MPALPGCSVRIARKSFDGRWKKHNEPCFTYTVDLHFNARDNVPKCMASREGVMEALSAIDANYPNSRTDRHANQNKDNNDTKPNLLSFNKPRVIIVGAGPAGLFAALTLVEAGWKPIILERGKAVEQRGKSIGALFNRGKLDPESNLCYGEGGAGTWSDGKLTTRIGKNSDTVRAVLQLLVRHGAPPRILVDGKPHLGKSGVKQGRSYKQT